MKEKLKDNQVTSSDPWMKSQEETLNTINGCPQNKTTEKQKNWKHSIAS